MINEDTFALATKNGANLFEMPTPIGKSLGACTKADLDKMVASAQRTASIMGRAARGTVLSAKDRQHVTSELAADEVYQAKALAWARAQ